MNELLRGRPPVEQPRPRPEVKKSPENPEQSIAQAAKSMEDIAREYGIEAVREMLVKMQTAIDEGRGMKAEISEVIKAQPERSRFQAAALEYLKKRDWVTETETGELIVDDASLFEGFALNKRDLLNNKKFAGMERFASGRLTFLANAFAGRDVYLQHEIANNPDAKAKPLFYLPETQEDALDVDKIKAADFHHGLWEVPRAFSGQQEENKATEFQQPASLTKQSWLETSMAAIIYHPRYGAGERGPDGRLKIRSGGKMQNLSGKWLVQEGLTFSIPGRPQALEARPTDILQEYAPKLIEAGLVRPEDFKVDQVSVRREEKLRISSNGVLSIGGVKHYLGRQYADKNLRIDNIDGQAAAIMELTDDGQAKPLGLMNIFEKGAVGLVERKTNSGSFFEAGGRLTKPRAFDAQEFQAPKPDEDPEAFFARKQKFEAWQGVVHFDNAIKQAADVRLFDLPKELQGEIQKHGNKLPQQEAKYVEFVKNLGQDGLEILASSISSSTLSEQIVNTISDLTLGEQQDLAPKLRDGLRVRREAMATLETAKQERRITDLEYRKSMFEINRRVTSLLTAAEDHSAIQASQEEPNPEASLARLTEQGRELTMFASIFRDAFKGSQEGVLEKLKGVGFEHRPAHELDDLEKHEILAMHASNWKQQKPDVYPKLRKSLETAFVSEDTKAYIMKKDGRTMAFMRFDGTEEPNTLYAASLTVHPDMRGSALGEAFMRAAMDAEAKEHVLKADFFPEFIVGSKYVEDMGWVITGVEEVAVSEGRTAKQLTIERDDRKNLRYQGKRSATTDTFSGLKTQQVDVRKGTDSLVEAVAQAQARGEVITRYFADQQNPNLRTLVFERKLEAQELERAA